MKEVKAAMEAINRNLNSVMVDSNNVIMQLAMRLAALEEENAKLRELASKNTGSNSKVNPHDKGSDS